MRFVDIVRSIRPMAVSLAPIPVEGSAILSQADPLGLFSILTMAKCAILIDGGYLLKRLPTVRPDIPADDAEQVALSVRQLVRSHLKALNEVYGLKNEYELLYRVFYYDARPYREKAHTAVLKQSIDYAKTPQAEFRTALFNSLKGQRNLAVRLGDVRKDSGRSWVLRPEPQRRLLQGEIAADQLADEDFVPALHQKGVDMRIGLDIASITLKSQADIIVLVSGDADFVPAAKLARREGVQFILDPLWHEVSSDLLEHIDALRSGFPRPSKRFSKGN